MNQRQQEMLDALVTPINKLREALERGEFATVAPPPRPASRPRKAGSPANGQAVAGKTEIKCKMPRGVRRRGKSLQVFLTHADGRTERRSVGNISVKMANQQRKIWQREIAEGRYVKKMPRKERVLFKVIGDSALDYAKKYKRDWQTDSGRIERMNGWWGGLYADSISTEMINEKLFENTTPRGSWTETTSNEYRALLSRIYNIAIDSGKFNLTANPAAKAHRYQLNNARCRELSAEEETRLRASIHAFYPQKESELDLALHLGCRRSNLYGIHAKGRRAMPPLDWKDIDLDWKIVRFPRAKAGLSYEVPLNEVAMKALKKLRERSNGTGPVIRKPSGREVHSSRKWFENCLEKAGISDFCWHDLRHSFASRLRRAGVPIEDIADLLDHKIPGLRMVTRYAHRDIEKLRAAVATLVQSGTKTVSESDTKTDTSAIIEFPTAQAV